ncbi:uncharacterized protein DNG_04283 [Cephalotrichum gorgonifer]|uniref:Uncharacterized protein n=1 Tax=Cephalotrichum gorgonifer TaxID=2041049 RepID=A0AAE8MVS9_9PEZI|nr:uncharacterized protein DNG_04283 [Cephalotrichum gorgonifer]
MRPGGITEADKKIHFVDRPGILAAATPNIGPMIWDDITVSDGTTRQLQRTSYNELVESGFLESRAIPGTRKPLPRGGIPSRRSKANPEEYDGGTAYEATEGAASMVSDNLAEDKAHSGV